MEKIKDIGHISEKHHLAWEEVDRESGGLYSEQKKKLNQKFPDLTPMELHVCVLVRAGFASWEIGKKLKISERTVENHRTNARKKLIINGENLHLYLHAL
jgi:AraC family chitin signaling transcriptional activator